MEGGWTGGGVEDVEDEDGYVEAKIQLSRFGDTWAVIPQVPIITASGSSLYCYSGASL